MTYTTYSAAQAASRAQQYTSFRTGMCLLFVKTVLTPTVSSPYGNDLPDANHAWEHAQHKEYTNSPPPGAPVYWRSGLHGHIALSLGNGYCRSTDWRTNVGTVHGAVGTVGIAKITSAWGMTYRGWSRDYAGLPIAGIQEGVAAPGTKSVDYTSPISLSQLRPGYSNTAVSRFEKGLWNKMGPDWRTRNAGLSAYYGDGKWGTVTTNTMLAAYRVMGASTAGVTYPGKGLLTWLGFRDVRA